MFKLLFYITAGLLFWTAYDYLSAEQPEASFLGGIIAKTNPNHAEIPTNSGVPNTLQDFKTLLSDIDASDLAQLKQQMSDYGQTLEQLQQENPAASEELRRLREQLADSASAPPENLDLDELMDQVKQLYQLLGKSEADNQP